MEGVDCDSYIVSSHLQISDEIDTTVLCMWPTKTSERNRASMTIVPLGNIHICNSANTCPGPVTSICTVHMHFILYFLLDFLIDL